MNWLDRLLCWVYDHTWEGPLPTYDGHECVHCGLRLDAIRRLAIVRRRERQLTGRYDFRLTGDEIPASEGLRRPMPKHITRREIRNLVR